MVDNKSKTSPTGDVEKAADLYTIVIFVSDIHVLYVSFGIFSTLYTMLYCLIFIRCNLFDP